MAQKQSRGFTSHAFLTLPGPGKTVKTHSPKLWFFHKGIVWTPPDSLDTTGRMSGPPFELHRAEVAQRGMAADPMIKIRPATQRLTFVLAPVSGPGGHGTIRF